MKVLIIHNSYQQAGGEDVVAARESRLLGSQGHTVISYDRSNHEVKRLSASKRLLLLKDIIYSQDSKREIQTILRREEPDIVHVHNTFMMISPSVYEACRETGTPVLQTLHNYRLLCPAWTLSRDGKICEDCVKGGLWNGVWHGCYRNSRVMTAAVAAMLQFHRISGTWENSVDGYVALSEFAKSKFIQGGLPHDKIRVKPNFVETDPGEKTEPGRFALFVGRLSPEKGIQTLISAWARLKNSYPLVVVGDGPLRESLEAEVRSQKSSSVTFKGWLPQKETQATMKLAAFLVTPSVWYEGPLTIAEAFAGGTPVLCSRLGVMQEMVDDRRTGLHFNPGDAEDLASKVNWILDHPKKLAEMGKAARREYESRYTAEQNYHLLMRIYEQTIGDCSRNLGTDPAPPLSLQQCPGANFPQALEIQNRPR
jgi:glycosyltransferase involved in cell wall biosynthesis